MLITNQLKNKQGFSDTEIKIADYMLANLELIPQLTIHELSEKTFSSPSSISRLCHKMKLAGYQDLKIQLAKELSSVRFGSKRIEDNLPFAKEAPTETIAKSILDLSIQSLIDTYDHLDFKQLEKVAHMLHQSQHVMLYGTGQSLILAQDFQYKLYRLHRSAQLDNQTGFQHMTAFIDNDIKRVALMISYYGQGAENIKIIKSLKKNNIPIILITGPKNNPLIPYAHEVIQVPSQEELTKKMTSYSSRTAIQLVLDILFALIFSYDYDHNQKLVSGKI